MNYIFFIICCNILFASATKTHIKPKSTFCVNCTFFKNDFKESIYGRCTLFPKIDIDNGFLVDGMKPIKTSDEYYHCSTARTIESMCGKEGKHFEKK